MRAPFVRPLLCGLVPLLAGVAVWALWRWTRFDILMLVGTAVLGLGCILSLVGAVTWFVDARAVRKQATPSPHGVLARAALAAVLLVACYPAAYAIVSDVSHVLLDYRVEIDNDSSAPVTCRVFGGGVDVAIGPIPPGESAATTFRIRHDGELRCSLETADGTHDLLLEGYVTNGNGGRAEVRIDADGTPTVRGGDR